jgi:pimeloyl-ACP methyl ester carboxylesterase
MKLYSNILGQGQAFIILHGFLGMGDNWKTIGNKFSEQGFEIHLVDQRNHGRSFQSDVFDYNNLVGDLKQYCTSHNLKNIVLLGHSMGGKTAMLFATKYPELVSKLIIADISPRFYPSHHQDILNGLSALNFEVLKSRKQAEDVLANFISDFGTRQFLLKNLYWVEKGQLGLRFNLKALKENVEEVGEALPENAKFEKDTLFLKGDKSDYITLDDEILIGKHFSKVEIKTIPNAGHWLHAENPQEFYQTVMAFID